MRKTKHISLMIALVWGIIFLSLTSAGAAELIETSKTASPQEIQDLIEAGAAVNVRNDQGETPLIAAARYNPNPLVVMVLIENGAIIEARDNSGRSALYNAARYNDSLVVLRTLINYGAAVNVVANDGTTPLLAAAEAGHDDKIRILVRAGARINQRDSQGRTVLHILSLKSDRLHTFRILVQAGANLDSQDHQGRTPLHYAVARRSMGAARYLLQQGAEINVRDKQGRTPLLLAAESVRTSALLELLLNYGANIQQRDNTGRTAFLKAAAADRPVQVLSFLLEEGADINEVDDNGQGVLHYILQGRVKEQRRLAWLLEQGAEVNLSDNKGVTPLMLAAANTTSEEVIFSLLAAGADVTQRDDEGRRVVDYLDGNSALFNTDAYWALQYMEPDKDKLETLTLKSPESAAGRSLVIPSLGHAYAENWWPKGTLFLAGEVTMLGLAATRSGWSEAAPYLLGFAALKAFEIFDAMNEVERYNEEAEEYNQEVSEFNRRIEQSY
ncbi:MAG: ankyrin repeat domain-containing protein [Bacillota bacterium]